MFIIAHRAGPGIYPEQSIQSAREALKNGADMVEMDVRETSDGALVVCHDEDTGRMFGVSGSVHSTTLAEFMAMRHKSDRSFAPHTLADVLSCKVQPLLLHCKQSGPSFMTKLCRIICEYGAAATTTLGIESPADAAIVRQNAPECKILAFMPHLSQLADFAKEDIDYIRLWEFWVAPEHIAAVREEGKQVWVMSNNEDCGGCGYTTAQQLIRFAEMGVHSVLVNDIPWAMTVSL